MPTKKPVKLIVKRPVTIRDMPWPLWNRNKLIASLEGISMRALVERLLQANSDAYSDADLTKMMKQQGGE